MVRGRVSPLKCNGYNQWPSVENAVDDLGNEKVKNGRGEKGTSEEWKRREGNK